MCRLTSIFSCCPWTFLFVNCGENNCLSFWIFLPVCTLNFYIIMIYFPYLFIIYFCHLKKTWLCISIWELMSAVSTQSHSADVYILVLLPTIVCVLCKLNFVMSLCVCAIFLLLHSLFILGRSYVLCMFYVVSHWSYLYLTAELIDLPKKYWVPVKISCTEAVCAKQN